MEPGNPDDFAIVIGIDKYASLPPLRSAVSDATQFAKWLIEVGGVPDDHIILVKSPPRLPAQDDLVSPTVVHVTNALTRLGVIEKMREESPERRRIGRRLYFYFSGHGFGPDPVDVGMLFAHATTDFLKRNMGLLAYRKMFQNGGLFDEVVYVLDCCRDDERTAETSGPEFSVPSRPGPQPRAREFVIMAAGWGSKAFEAAVPDDPASRRSGLLTEALLEGLGLGRPPTALDQLGRVTSSTLLAHVKARVPQLAQAAGVPQSPKGEDDDSAPIVLATFPLTSAEAVTLRVVPTLPQVQTGTLFFVQKFLDGAEVEVARRELSGFPAGEPWEMKLRPGLRYAVRHLETGVSLDVDLAGDAAGTVVGVNFPIQLNV